MRERLNERQARFLELYLSGPVRVCENATRAARLAGYAWPDRAGPRLKTHPAIAAAIARHEAERRQRLAADRDERDRRLEAEVAAIYAEGEAEAAAEARRWEAVHSWAVRGKALNEARRLAAKFGAWSPELGAKCM